MLFITSSMYEDRWMLCPNPCKGSNLVQFDRLRKLGGLLQYYSVAAIAAVE